MSTQAIVTEKNNTVIVDNKQPQVIIAGMIGPQGVTSVQGLSNVDVSTLTNGSVLVYASATEKWTATTTLSAQNLEGGEF